jgi:hypothetical protein
MQAAIGRPANDASATELAFGLRHEQRRDIPDVRGVRRDDLLYHREGAARFACDLVGACMHTGTEDV